LFQLVSELRRRTPEEEPVIGEGRRRKRSPHKEEGINTPTRRR